MITLPEAPAPAIQERVEGGKKKNKERWIQLKRLLLEEKAREKRGREQAALLGSVSASSATDNGGGGSPYGAFPPT